MSIALPESLQRRADEPTTAYRALVDYAMLGSDRSLDGLATQYRSDPDAHPPTRRRNTLAIWSVTYNWQARIGDYDEQLAAQELAQIEAQWAARREQIREESWQLAQRLRDRALELLAHPTVEESSTETDAGKTITIVIKPSRWAQRDIPAIAETFNKLARLAVGLDTDQIRIIEGIDPGDLAQKSDEELAALKAKIMRKRGG